MAVKGRTTSTFSFGSELAAYREWFIANRQQFTAREHDIGLRVLERWQGRNRNDIEEIWNKIISKVRPDQCPANPADFAAQFISAVISCRTEAETYKTILHAEPELGAKIARRRELHLKNQDYNSLICDDELRKQYGDIRRRVFSRDTKTAPRKFFMNDWSGKFQELCGQPLDEVVAFLTQIAFDIQVTADAVRDSRKPRRLQRARQ
jgi:hypothetical protein